MAAAVASSCDRPPAGQPKVKDGEAAAAATKPSACAPGDARLKTTGLCQAEAAALLLAAPGPAATPPDGCAWTIEEAAMPGGAALLYRGARCQARTTRLSFVPGTPTGRLDIAAWPYEPAETGTLARIVPAANEAALLETARAAVDDPAERARCRLRPAASEGWPGDALVVDEVPPPPGDGVRAACGRFGLDEDSQTFWRLSQGHGWFFQLGQESPVVDPGSFTLVARNRDGRWVRA
jgi:hypothetical protein